MPDEHTIGATLNSLRAQMNALTIAFEQHKKAQEETAKIVRELNTAWSEATGMVRLVKWVAAVAAFAGGVVVAFRALFPGGHT